MYDRCSRITTVAEERFSRLVTATPEDFGATSPGRLFVGSCGEAVQWAGYRHELSMDSQWWAVGHHCWHEYCARFWLHLNYKSPLDDVTWEQRLFVAVWIALTALALGEDVLVHCRQGKHRSGIVVMLLMAILAVAGSEDYDTIEAKYFERNSRVQWSEWHEWWYNDKGEPIDPDRWRLWKMWQKNRCSAYTVQLRNTP